GGFETEENVLKNESLGKVDVNQFRFKSHRSRSSCRQLQPPGRSLIRKASVPPAKTVLPSGTVTTPSGTVNSETGSGKVPFGVRSPSFNIPVFVIIFPKL